MYGSAHGQYPVQQGDVWRVGKHRLICADTETFDWGTLPAPTIIYSDPPWDSGHAHMFRNKAQAGPGQGWPAPILGLTRAMNAYRCPTYLQWGAVRVPECIRIIEGQTVHRLRAIWPLSYNGYGMVLLAFTIWREMLPCTVIDGNAIHCVLRAALQTGDVVLDPFAGVGTTLQIAAYWGYVGIGIEIIPHKMALGLRRLSHIEGVSPYREERT